MERKFLKDLGIADEAIDKVMAENGKDIEKVKGERDEFETKYKDVQKKLKAFDGVDVNDLQGRIKKLTEDLKTKDDDYASKLDERDFQSVLKAAASTLKVKNIDAALAVLGKEKVDALKASKNREKDITDTLKAQKESKDTAYLYETDRAPRVVSSTPGASKTMDDAKSKANEGLRSLYGKGSEE